MQNSFDSNPLKKTQNWHIEYSAREAFNSSRAKLTSSTSPLTASWWHNVTIDMEEDQETFEKMIDALEDLEDVQHVFHNVALED